VQSALSARLAWVMDLPGQTERGCQARPVGLTLCLGQPVMARMGQLVKFSLGPELSPSTVGCHTRAVEAK
jgi:hypothetical protein